MERPSGTSNGSALALVIGDEGGILGRLGCAVQTEVVGFGVQFPWQKWEDSSQRKLGVWIRVVGYLMGSTGLSQVGWAHPGMLL